MVTKTENHISGEYYKALLVLSRRELGELYNNFYGSVVEPFRRAVDHLGMKQIRREGLSSPST